MSHLAKLTRNIRDPVVSALTELFSHGPTPLENTLDYRGDPGLLGPDSVSGRVLGDAAVFVGGIRALVVQSAHPEVVAGVEDHSTYRFVPRLVSGLWPCSTQQCRRRSLRYRTDPHRKTPWRWAAPRDGGRAKHMDRRAGATLVAVLNGESCEQSE